MKKHVCLSALLIVIPLATTSAQQREPPLEPGARVRVTVPDRGVTSRQATFRALEGDTLVVVTDSTAAYPLSSVTRLELFGGRHGHAWLGAGLGFGVGAVAGVITAVIACENTLCNVGPDVVLAGAGVGGAAGALLGAGVGALIKTDRWDEVPLDRIRVSATPGEGGIRLGLSVAF